ncbi:MAG: hypothetical protein ACR2Q3_14990 [Woeseiaceae bacterium]
MNTLEKMLSVLVPVFATIALPLAIASLATANVRPTLTIGADRPTDYGIELGYKWVGW